MSADRELLELAAKAAGLTGGVYGELSGGEPVLYFQTVGIWAPITDDGDALRLAVMLGLEISVAFAQAYACPFGALAGSELHEPFGDVHGPGTLDRYAATRRVIVRAAAQIGRAMP